MKNLKIAYLTWGKSPCELRRFAHFSRLEKLNAELYHPHKSYDVIVVTQNSDLTYWSRFPKSNAKIIFDFVDSYLEKESWELQAGLRGLAKFVTGQHQYLDFSYRDLLGRMISRADAVVCSTPEQRIGYLALNSNVHDILDINDEQVKFSKTNYELGEVVHFAWEGMGVHTWAFQEIAPVLKKIHAKRPIALHLVTDLQYRAYNGPMALEKQVKPYLRKILGNVPVYLYEWNQAMLSLICSHCDIALLPIPKEPAIYWAKPENRLLMLWRMGLPVVASANPAFMRSMKRAGNEQACENLQDWEEKLEALLMSDVLRRESAERGRAYSDEYASKSALCQKWTKVLESVL